MTAREPRETERGEFLLELDAGLNVRLGAASGFQEEETVGGAYSAGFYWSLVDDAALGFELQHTELGNGTDQSGQSLVNVEFSATTAWLAGRFVPFRSSWAEAFVGLRAGLAVQHVDSHGMRQREGLLNRATPFSCTELDGPGLAFGGGIGARFGVGPGFSLITRLDGSAHRLSSDPIGSCAVGVGSSTSVGVGVGLAYEFGPSAPTRSAARPGRAAQTW